MLHCELPQQAQHMGAREESGLSWTYCRVHEDLQEKQQQQQHQRWHTHTWQRWKQIKFRFIRTFQRLQFVKEEKLRWWWGRRKQTEKEEGGMNFLHNFSYQVHMVNWGYTPGVLVLILQLIFLQEYSVFFMWTSSRFVIAAQSSMWNLSCLLTSRFLRSRDKSCFSFSVCTY